MDLVFFRPDSRVRVLPNKNNRIVSNTHETRIEDELECCEFFMSHFPGIYGFCEVLNTLECSTMDENIMEQAFSIIMKKKIELYEKMERGKLMEKLQQIESSLNVQRKYLIMIKSENKMKQNRKKVA